MFDPYHKWLGIPKEEQPPTYYRLLGLNPKEKDREVIEEAAIRQTAHVRAYQLGPQAAECTRLLNEIALARATLLNSVKRKAYDLALAANEKKKQQSESTVERAATAGPIVTWSYGKAAKSDSSRLVVAGVSGAVFIAVAVSLWLLFGNAGTREKSPTIAGAKSKVKLETEPPSKMGEGNAEVEKNVPEVKSKEETQLQKKEFQAQPKDSRLPAPTALPIAWWKFDAGLRDQIGNLHAGVHSGNPQLVEGKLRLGPKDVIKTGTLPYDIVDRTIEAWIDLPVNNQKIAKLMSVERPEVWDGIIFSDFTPGRWTPGSSYRHRSKEFDMPAENAAPGQLLQLAAVYARDNSITLYRNGKILAGPFIPQGPMSQLQFYPKGEAWVEFGGGIQCDIAEARLYSRALTPDEIAASYGEKMPSAPITPKKKPDPIVVSKLPQPPDAEALAEAEKKIRSLFKAEYAKTALADKRALAAKLRQHAGTIKEASAERFVLLRETKDLASQGGDIGTAFLAIDDLDELFHIDGLAFKVGAVEKASSVVNSKEPSAAVVDSALLATRLAVYAENYDHAERLLKAAQSVVGSAQSVLLRDAVAATRKQVTLLMKEAEPAKAARAVLEKNEHEPKANAALGRYLALARGDWKRGLPHLARGDNSELAAWAQRDLAGARDAKEQADLGDGWWKLSQQAPYSDWKEQLVDRARFWYARALPDLDALRKTEVEKRCKLDFGKLDLLPGLFGEYFNGHHANQRVARRIDAHIFFNWMETASVSGQSADNFSVRWVGWIKPPKPGRYIFRFYFDDGFRFYVDGKTLVDMYSADGGQREITVDFTKEYHSVAVDFVEIRGTAVMQWRWRSADMEVEIVPPEVLFHDQYQRDALTYDYAAHKGIWGLMYANKVYREYQIDEQGNIQQLTEGKAQGKMYRNNKDLMIGGFGDGTIERVRIADGKITIEHYNTPNHYPNKPTNRAVGAKRK
ncbi:MAG: PA14 domain-containing protein [Gemmataceae bacterium]|nr:PA14 domain-containing protein [Gemmataceae bacterium]MCI0740761.1 PA14 domain-containing protein [Gemmataceae bacterium]